MISLLERQRNKKRQDGRICRKKKKKHGHVNTDSERKAAGGVQGMGIEQQGIFATKHTSLISPSRRMSGSCEMRLRKADHSSVTTSQKAACPMSVRAYVRACAERTPPHVEKEALTS